MKETLSSILSKAIHIAEEAGERILAVYHNESNEPTTYLKDDHSPLTQADILANNYILESLKTISTEWPIISEESKKISWQERQKWQRYWLIDPLDGTKEFIQRNGEFTVNIALIDQGRPILGVVYAPELRFLYYAAKDFGAYYRQTNQLPIKLKTTAYKSYQQTSSQPISWKIVASRSHHSQELNFFLKQFNYYELLNMGSSLKFCLVASGQAHLYPRLGPTSEWDTAAAQCIVEEAGGIVVNTSLQPLLYNQKDSFLNPHFIVAAAKEDLELLKMEVPHVNIN